MRRRIAAFLAICAVGSAAAAWAYWTNGAPPTWSYFSERVSTEVLSAEVVEPEGTSGNARHHARIQVAWPPGSGRTHLLPGVEPHHVPRIVWTAEQVVRSYPVGQPTTVRVVGGQPFADRTDVTEMAYAIFFSVSTIACLAFSGMLARGADAAGNDGEERT